MSWMEYCPIHGAALQDFNGYGERYRRPVCLECRWESGKGPILTRILHKASSIKRKFFEHWGPETTYIRRNLTDRLNRAVKSSFETLEEVAFAIAGPKRPQPPRHEAVPVQSQKVLSVLRAFEVRRGSARTKQTREEEKKQHQLNTIARRNLLSVRSRNIEKDEAYRWLAEKNEKMQGEPEPSRLSLDDPSVAHAVEVERFHELGGAKKRRRSNTE